MGVKRNVFASKSERRNFYKLSRVWGRKYRIYHNLPFLNVFDPRNIFDFSDWGDIRPIVLSDLEVARLKKTSIDYTLCDQQDSPILCIEFDGLQQGFNVGTAYYPNEIPEQLNPWRREITELKLRVAFGSLFPYFVVGSRYFADISSDVELTIVDGIIGEVLANRAVQARVGEGFDPNEVGYSQDEFDSLPEWEQREIIQDWLWGIEVEAEMEHNPISRKRAELQSALGVTSWSVEYMTYPSVDYTRALRNRGESLNSAVLHGAKVILHTPSYGDIEGEAWLPNFKAIGYTGLGLCENVAALLALDRLKQMRARQAYR